MRSVALGDLKPPGLSVLHETRPQVEEGITECVWLPFDDALRTLTYDNARQVLEAAGRRLAALEGRG